MFYLYNETKKQAVMLKRTDFGLRHMLGRNVVMHENKEIIEQIKSEFEKQYPKHSFIIKIAN